MQSVALARILKSSSSFDDLRFPAKKNYSSILLTRRQCYYSHKLEHCTHRILKKRHKFLLRSNCNGLGKRKMASEFRQLLLSLRLLIYSPGYLRQPSLPSLRRRFHSCWPQPVGRIYSSGVPYISQSRPGTNKQVR